MGQKEKQMIDEIFNSEHGKKPKESNDAENIQLIVKEWLNPKHVKYKTRYSPNQVTAISIFQSLANKYNIKTLKRFITEYQSAKLSEGGQSSEELKEILIARMPEPETSGLEKLTKFLG